ncbi:MAG TPA: class I SAM-dependent methyltransferase [Cytophagales bacterium]|nr:class I SAM-dependent methyltransferase [Cytophagales bacterium]
MSVYLKSNYSQYTKAIDLKRLRFITDNLKRYAPNGKKILDVGCGNGNISIHLGKLGYEVLGIDISDKAIAKASAYNDLPNVKFEVRSAEEIVASGVKYDGIICSEVLEHLNAPEKLLSVIHQILKDDGVLIVTVPNGFGPRELFMTKPMQWMRKENNFLWKFVSKTKQTLGYNGTTIQSDAEDLTHVQFFTHKALKKLSKQNNFSIVKLGKSNFVEDVFPFSLVTKKVKALQFVDCKIADVLPSQFTGGFNTVWKKV